MLRNLLISAVLLVPLTTFAQGNGHAYGHTKHVPEIDGDSIVIGIALLGGVLSLVRRGNKK